MAQQNIDIHAGAGDPSSGVPTSSENSTVSGGNISVNLQYKQVPSSTVGKVKIQARIVFSYAGYERDYTATFMFRLNNQNGSPLINTSGGANLIGWHRNATAGKYYSNWINLFEINNTTSVTIWAAVDPTETSAYKEVYFTTTLSGVCRSYTWSFTKGANISSASYTITDSSKVYGSDRSNQTASTAIVYDGDKVSWSASPNSGYTVSPAPSGAWNISGGARSLTLIGLIKYSLSVLTDSNVTKYSYNITDSSGVYGSNRTNQTATSAEVYAGDVITWSSTLKPGYYSSNQNGTITVNSDVIINLVPSPQATIHVRHDGSWVTYYVYIRRNGAWVLHQANIRKNGAWVRHY